MGVASASTVALGLSPAVGGHQAPALLDSEQFARLYQETFESVYRYAWLLCRDACRAEDIAAEVFFRAWRGRAGFRGEGKALSWLLSIAHNCTLSALRGRRESADLDTISNEADRSALPVEVVLAASEAERLHQAIRELTPDQQQVIFLRFFEQLPHEAVAVRLGRSANAIRATQFRALHRLRTLLEQSDD